MEKDIKWDKRKVYSIGGSICISIPRSIINDDEYIKDDSVLVFFAPKSIWPRLKKLEMIIEDDEDD